MTGSISSRAFEMPVIEHKTRTSMIVEDFQSARRDGAHTKKEVRWALLRRRFEPTKTAEPASCVGRWGCRGIWSSSLCEQNSLFCVCRQPKAASCKKWLCTIAKVASRTERSRLVWQIDHVGGLEVQPRKQLQFVFCKKNSCFKSPGPAESRRSRSNHWNTAKKLRLLFIWI